MVVPGLRKAWVDMGNNRVQARRMKLACMEMLCPAEAAAWAH